MTGAATDTPEKYCQRNPKLHEPHSIFIPMNSIPRTIVVTAMIACAMIGSGRADTFITLTNAYSAPLGYGGLRDGWVNGVSTGTSPYKGTLGFSFYVVSSDILVTSLGYYDGPNSAAANVPGYTADGLLNAHAVGLWDGTGALIASANIPTVGATAIGDFQFVPITPITLNAGGSYTLGGLVTDADSNGTGDVFFDAQGNPAFSAGPDVNIYDGPYSPMDGAHLQEPQNPAGGYMGGNFQYSIVPEPATWVTLASGIALLALRRRTRRV